MKWRFYMVALFMPLCLSAQSAVHGEITRDTRWVGQVFIDGDVIVRPGAVLSIAPGSRIIIEANRDVTRSGRDPQRVELIVLGKLLARGEKGEGKIIFTSSAREPHLGDWYGIVIKNRREPSLLDNCVIEYAHIGVTCYGSSPVLSNSEIRFNHYAGVSCEVRSRAILRRCTLMGNDFAGLVCELASSPVVENSVITQNENGIIIFDRSAPDLGQVQAGENASRGQNRIFNNFEVNIYNQSDREIFAQNNIWNVEDPEEIHQTIVDNADDPGFGQVVIEPMYREAPAPVVARRPSRQPPSPASPPPPPAETLLVTYTPTPSIASNGRGNLSESDTAASPASPPPEQVVERLSLSSTVAARDTSATAASASEAGHEAIPPEEDQGASAPPEPSESPAPEVVEPVLEAFLDGGGRRHYVRYVKPEYPEIYQRTGHEGKVLLEVIVGRDGQVEHYRVLRSDGDLFTAAAIAAIKKFRYRPETFRGQPVRFVVVEPFIFKLPK